MENEKIIELCASGDLSGLQQLVDADFSFYDAFEDADVFGLPIANACNGEIAQFLYENNAVSIVESDVPVLNAVIKNVANGKIDISTLRVVLLNEEGINSDWDGLSGDLAIHAAIRSGNIDIVELLISSGAALNIASNDGDTPLGIAAEQNDLDIADLLIKNGAPSNEEAYFFIIDFDDPEDAEEIYSPLSLAKTDEMRLLISKSTE